MPKYHLKPFHKLTDYQTTVDINCGLVGSGDLSLDLTYTVTGDLTNLIFEKSISNPERTDELWKKSCFEIFLNNNSELNYYEFNFSPNHNWNSYSFDNYRTKAKYLLLPRAPKILSHSEKNFYELQVSLEFAYPNLTNLNNLYISPTVILQHTNDTQSFWAINHSKTKPDFHLKNLFFPLLS